MTTPYIEAKKAEVRELVELHINGEDTREQFMADLFPLIDTLLDEIESKVLTDEHSQDCCVQVRERFQHLRTGVETEV